MATPRQAQGFHGLLERIAVGAFVVMLIAAVLQVLFRYVLKISMMWTEELARLLMVWVTFLGAALVFREGDHIRIDYFFRRLPPRAARWVTVIMNLLMLLFVVAVLVGGIRMMRVTWEVYAASMPWLRMAYVYLAVVLAALIMAVHLVQQTVQLVFGRGVLDEARVPVEGESV